MKNFFKLFFIFCVLFFELVFSQTKNFVFDTKTLNQIKQEINTKEYEQAYKNLYKDAEKALNFKPVSVIDKNSIPVSGSKNDYMSLAPYWWPDPTKPDGLPYIRKDGERNPELKNFPDHPNFSELISNVFTLSLSYYYSNNEKYSEQCLRLLRKWFLDPATKMNPNLNFGQFIPGLNNGRGAGIIETHTIYELIESLNFLNNSKYFPSETQDSLKLWFTDYLNWLRTSKNGINESEAKNNHGSWYNVQVVSIALFLDSVSLAKKIVEQSKTQRIEIQIDSIGRQPFELVRTKAIGYSLFNLKALFVLSQLAEKMNVNLWDYNQKNGGIKKALDWLLPFLLKEKPFEYKQIAEVSNDEVTQLLFLAYKVYHDQKYFDALNKLGFKNNHAILTLLYGNIK